MILKEGSNPSLSLLFFFNSFGLQAPFLKLLIQPHSLRRTLAKKKLELARKSESPFTATLSLVNL